MTLAMTSHSTGPLLPNQLEVVLLNNNPTKHSRYSQRHNGELYDIANERFTWDGCWSVACNQPRIDKGTLCLIARYNKTTYADIGGVLLCEGEPQSEEIELEDEDGNVISATESYVEGPLDGWPEPLWLPGTEIATLGWPAGTAPFGGCGPQFQGGRRLPDHLIQAICDRLSPATMELMRYIFVDWFGTEPVW